VQAVVQRAATAGRTVRQALTAMKDKIAQLLKSRFEKAKPVLREAGREFALEAAEEFLERQLERLSEDRLHENCYVPALTLLARRPRPPVGPEAGMEFVDVSWDVAECVRDLLTEGDEEGSPTREEAQQIFEQSLTDAQRIGAATLAEFPPPPLSAPERSAAVIETTVPAGFDAERIGFVHIAAVNQGQPLPLSDTFISVAGGSFPWVHAGHVPGQGNRIVLTDENADGRWDHNEVVNAVVEVRPPNIRSGSWPFTYGFVSGGVEFSGGNPMTINVRGKLEELRVYNMVTNGPTQMREDVVPARLTTQPWTFCGRRGCNINGTERWTGGAYHHAVCWTTGEWTTNGDNSNTPRGWSDDGNPHRFTSNLYYGVQLGGTFGFVSEVWIHPDDRHGLGLPVC
jgi:hypothetical protein